MQQHTGTVLLETPRLQLRRFAYSDVPAVFTNWASDPAVAQYNHWEPHRDLAVTQDIVAGWVAAYHSPSVYNWALVLPARQNACGAAGSYPAQNACGAQNIPAQNACGAGFWPGGSTAPAAPLPGPVGSLTVVRQSEEHGYAEVGYSLCRKLWGQGLMTEALRAVLSHLFWQAGFARIQARHDAANPASGRVLQKCGMRHEGTLRKAERRPDGTFRDICLWAILREEMPPPESHFICP